MIELATEVAKAEDEAFAVVADAAGRPTVMCNDVPIGQLVKGADLLSPIIDTAAVASALEGEALAAVTTRAAAWVEAQLAKHLEGLRAIHALSKDPVTPGEVRALAVQLVEGVGIIPRRQVADVMKAFDKDLRTTARAAGTHFGALDIYHYAMAKPRASFWRTVLSSVWYGHALPAMPDESAVHLTDFPFASEESARLAGYRRVGEEYLRVDLAERLVKQAHEKRGEAHDFAVDLSYATSLGLSEAGLIALLEDAGFRRIDAPEDVAPEATAEVAPSDTRSDAPTEPAAEITSDAEPVSEPTATVEADVAPDAEPVSEPAVEVAAAAEPDASADESADSDGEVSAPAAPEAAAVSGEAPTPELTPEPEIRVGDKGEFKVLGNSFFYEGPKLWFSWGRGLGLRGPRADAAKGAPRRSDDNRRDAGQRDTDGDAGRNNRRKKGGNTGQFKGQKSGGDRQNRSRDNSPPPTKAYTEKPRAQSALAEALGAQLAAARAKQKD